MAESYLPLLERLCRGVAEERRAGATHWDLANGYQALLYGTTEGRVVVTPIASDPKGQVDQLELETLQADSSVRLGYLPLPHDLDSERAVIERICEELAR